MAGGDPLRRSRALARALRKHSGLRDPRMAAAFAAVPRHLFLPDLPLEEAYADEAVPIKRGEGGIVLSSSSQPSMMVLMLNQLAPCPGDNVLEIGTGTGYNAAIMQQIVGEEGRVTSVELDADVVEFAGANLQRAGCDAVHLIHADGAGGYPPHAPYDGIIATVGIWDVTRAWREQLKAHGRIVAPLWVDGFQVSAAFRRDEDGTLISRLNLPCGFIHLRGAAAGPKVHLQVGSSALILASNAANRIDAAALHLALSDDAEDCHLGVRLTSSDYWHGFLPYLILNHPRDFIFAIYAVQREQRAYGIEGSGFALISGGSACFVPYQGEGEAWGFGAADAFVALREALITWKALGQPGRETLRMRLLPVEQDVSAIPFGKLYRRYDHNLHIWQDITL